MKSDRTENWEGLHSDSNWVKSILSRQLVGMPPRCLGTPASSAHSQLLPYKSDIPTLFPPLVRVRRFTFYQTAILSIPYRKGTCHLVQQTQSTTHTKELDLNHIERRLSNCFGGDRGIDQRLESQVSTAAYAFELGATLCGPSRGAACLSSVQSVVGR